MLSKESLEPCTIGALLGLEGRTEGKLAFLGGSVMVFETRHEGNTEVGKAPGPKLTAPRSQPVAARLTMLRALVPQNIADAGIDLQWTSGTVPLPHSPKGHCEHRKGEKDREVAADGRTGGGRCSADRGSRRRDFRRGRRSRRQGRCARVGRRRRGSVAKAVGHGNQGDARSLCEAEEFLGERDARVPSSFGVACEGESGDEIMRARYCRRTKGAPCSPVSLAGHESLSEAESEARKPPFVNDDRHRGGRKLRTILARTALTRLSMSPYGGFGGEAAARLVGTVNMSAR
ncbi:MAG: hypothetical protein BJ554DRAFT_64 [Olpidium bornovanus]|uniref:Uncharacterized protein n=1 Tax=Olpidium bornovanus TaxID=278681 RepID=A0A8H7ZU49_9FUNG|nr:MAG: hypothetical protein BJ554DRAFT_64 [Olpidium bornovanus]